MAGRVTSARFVGRERERDEILGALDRSRRGEGSFVLLAGEAGVGKTRLVEEVAHTIRLAGSLAVTGRCVELGESGAPYSAIRQAMRELDRAIGRDRFTELIGSYRTVVGP